MGSGPARCAIAALIALACASSTAPAVARAPTSRAENAEDREVQRTELYREAMRDAGGGHWAEAKERLRAALAIRSSPKVLFSLAQTEEQLGQLASAQGDYARALEAAAVEGKADVVQSAELAQRALFPRVPHLRVTVAAAGGGAGSATLDEQPIALGTAVAVDPGEHKLVVRAPGLRTATVSMRVSEGQQVELPVTLEVDRGAPTLAAPSPPPSAPPPLSLASAPVASAEGADARPGAAPLRTVGYVVAGLGIFGLGAGAAFGLESIAKHNDAQRVCPGVSCSPSGASLWHDAVTFGDASTIAFAAGGAALLAGTIFWLAAPKSNGHAARVALGPGSFALEGVW
jgi:hypothetical protein